MVSTTNSWWRTDAVAWSARDWSVELRGDEIADIRHRGRLLLRGVRAAVRDQGWQTVPASVEEMTTAGDSLVMRLRHEGLGAHIDSTLRITAGEATLRIEWDAVSANAFRTCRTGLVVLHPASDAGRHAVVMHPDETTESVAFPASISPHQPIMDIRALRVDDEFELTFTGDVFEMEDQRNWTDASFKTYSRPLALPYPYRLEAGERVHQALTVHTLTGAARKDESGGDVTISLHEAGAFPEIGIEASTAPAPVPPTGAGDFRVVELDLTTPAWRAALERAALDGVALDVRLVTDGDSRVLSQAASALAALTSVDVLRVAAFDPVEHVSTVPVVAALRDALADAGLAIPVLTGARSHFTELNREQHRIARDVDGLALNTTPLFHTLDTEQLVEALPMQRLIAEQAVLIADGLPVHIGPVSLRPRFNNVATTPEPAPIRTDLAEGYGAEFTGAADDRQSSTELGAWLIASAAALAVPGVASLSWFETWGPRGLVSSSGRTPAADAVDALLSLSSGTLLTGVSGDGLVWAIGGRDASGVDILVANVDAEPRRISVRGPGGLTASTALAAGTWTRLGSPGA